MSEELKNGRYENLYGTVRWYKDDKLHREDGPAIEYEGGAKAWYVNGKLHREDGPAWEASDGTKYWYLFDRSVTEEEFNHWLAKKQLNERLTEQLEVKPTGKKVKI